LRLPKISGNHYFFSMHKLRLLTLALIFSGGLNIAFVTAFVFSSFEKQTPPSPTVLTQERRFVYEKIAKFSFAELMAALTHKEMRDLSLAMLVSKFDFDLYRALSAKSLVKAPLLLSEGEAIETFPGLSEEQYEAIIRFAYEEKWPFTSKGLFARLKLQPKMAKEKTLAEAFFVTQEFHAAELLFQKSGLNLQKQQLLDLICEGPWENVAGLLPVETLIFSPEHSHAFLLSYLAHGSEAAAKILSQSPSALPKPVAPPASVAKLQSHVVKDGETLWKICRQHHVKLEDLRKVNQLEGEKVFPGMTLLIP